MSLFLIIVCVLGLAAGIALFILGVCNLLETINLTAEDDREDWE